MSKPKVKLVGENGNIFSLMAIASREMKRQGFVEESKEMLKKIHGSGSYHEALNIIQEYCDVS